MCLLPDVEFQFLSALNWYKMTSKPSLSFRSNSASLWREEQVPAGSTHRVPVPAAHMSRCDGSWGNYPLSRCVCNFKLRQGFPSGSSPAQVSEQLMTFRSNRMKEMAVVCSQPHTTFVLLSAVCLNLPATLFTPQGDHVIRSPPLAHLSSCSTTPPEKDCSSWKKGKQYKQAGDHNIKCSSFTGP